MKYRSYFLWKTKKYSRLSSATIMIGTFRVNMYSLITLLGRQFVKNSPLLYMIYRCNVEHLFYWLLELLDAYFSLYMK